MSIVLISTDHSDHSKYALEYYFLHVHREGNIVKVIHVPDFWKNVRPMEGPTPGRLAELVAETNKNTEEIKQYTQSVLSKAGVAGEFFVGEGKDPWQVVTKKAEEIGANLIVIGCRGQGTVKRTVLGSCSDSVVHHAHCPVLVCRHH